MRAPATTRRTRPDTVAAFVRFLETGECDGLFAPDVTSDINFPHLHVTETTADALVSLRRHEHPGLTDVRVERLDATEQGWVIQLEERWDRGGQRWYSREILRVDVAGDRVTGLAVYCTGDWDEALQRQHGLS